MFRVYERHRWILCYAFMLAFALVMLPTLAYADTYVATEDSAVRAAMVYLGYDPDEGESTNKLVTAFYDATSGDEYTGWQSFVNGLYQPLDTVNYNEQWWSPADGFMFSFQVDGARSDAAKIYAAWKKTSGGGSGGGSGGAINPPQQDNYYYIPATRLTNTVTRLSIGGTYYRLGPSGTEPYFDGGFTFKISTSLLQDYLSGDYVLLFLSYGGNYSVTAANRGKSQQSVSVFEREGFSITIDNGNITSVTGTRVGNYIASAHRVVDVTDGMNILFIDGSVTGNTAFRPNSGYFAYATLGYSGEGGDVQPEPEPEPEPEPPTPPDPPVDPTPPEPDPTQPSQTIDLQGIIDRLDIIIRNQVVLINWLDDAFASVTANIQWLGELVDESFGWLWEVLDKLQGSIDAGISRITTWLEMIYRRIGGQGGTVSRPGIDTPTPWDDFLAWLNGILQRLLDLIFGVTPEALQNLLAGLADLTTKFPFSIPWDLAGLLALFVHDPVTPVFDAPLYNPLTDSLLSVHFDFSSWNGLMEIARDGEVLLFASWLIMATPDFYRHLNNVTGSD